MEFLTTPDSYGAIEKSCNILDALHANQDESQIFFTNRTNNFDIKIANNFYNHRTKYRPPPARFWLPESLSSRNYVKDSIPELNYKNNKEWTVLKDEPTLILGVTEHAEMIAHKVEEKSPTAPSGFSLTLFLPSRFILFYTKTDGTPKTESQQFFLETLFAATREFYENVIFQSSITIIKVGTTKLTRNWLLAQVILHRDWANKNGIILIQIGRKLVNSFQFIVFHDEWRPKLRWKDLSYILLQVNHPEAPNGVVEIHNNLFFYGIHGYPGSSLAEPSVI